MPMLLLLLAATPTLQLDVPFVHQRPDFCGEAVAEMALRRLGHDVTQDDVFDASGVDPLLGRGVWTNELARALRTWGLEPGQTWYRIDPRTAAQQVELQWRAVTRDLEAGQPSIVCMHYDGKPDTTEHFRLITGYDASRDEVIYQEPAEADGANRRMPRDEFLRLWTFKPARDRWTVIRLRLTPAAPRPTLPPARPLTPPVKPLPSTPRPADVSQHVQRLKETLPPGMTLVWEAPFLVIGDEAPEVVRGRAKDIVRWCRDLLLRDFFERAPSTLHEVWVLKDEERYRRISRTFFGNDPETPYGYYVSSRRALVMNIRPGYGTLTHELVHPFMHEAFPGTPAWLNEGLASLFEFPFEEGGHLKGRVNWRLPALKRGLELGVVPSFKALTEQRDDEFYEDRHGVSYATARYLCYWLQERGLLVAFVRRAIELQHEDPTGHRALTEVLGGAPDAQRAQWERFVRGLSQRRPASRGRQRSSRKRPSRQLGIVHSAVPLTTFPSTRTVGATRSPSARKRSAERSSVA